MQTNGAYIATWQDVRSRMFSLRLFVFIVTASKQINKQVWEGVEEFHYYRSLPAFSIFRQGSYHLLRCLFFHPHTCVRPAVCPPVRFSVVIIVYNRKPVFLKPLFAHRITGYISSLSFAIEQVSPTHGSRAALSRSNLCSAACDHICKLCMWYKNYILI